MPNMIQWQFALVLFIVTAMHVVVESKVFERCELAKLMHTHHQLNLTEVAHWVCIAKYLSGFNTSAQSESSSGGYHGLFQISDVYWCSPPGQGTGCNITCSKLKSDDLTDTLACVKLIYNEHQISSGDGYTAWNAYKMYCKDNPMSYIQDCFPGELLHNTSAIDLKSVNSSLKGSGKVYKRCELARELYSKHKIPMHEIPTWICIAEHESHLNTSVIGHVTAEGTAAFGLFQINEIYWCSRGPVSDGGGKACGLSCSQLLDNDITDDVQCVKRIFNEHAALTGDGFNAWGAYSKHCHNASMNDLRECFNETEIKQAQINSSSTSLIPYSTNQTGKIYTRCELAQELYYKYNFSMKLIPKWVCVAQHESSLKTGAIGRLNLDGSADYGLFQISALYWCSVDDIPGKTCNISCSKFLDADITDDVKCIKIIYDEHKVLSGDGFNAWAAYKKYCRKTEIGYVKECFSEKELREGYDESSTILSKACELILEFLTTHKIAIPDLLCKAQQYPLYSRAALWRSFDYGLFQTITIISLIYILNTILSYNFA